MEYLRSEQGLTLIETIIALTLVVLLTTAFAGAMVVGLRSETTSTNLDASSKLASEIFDWLSVGNNLINTIDNNSYEKTVDEFITGINEIEASDNNINMDKSMIKITLRDDFYIEHFDKYLEDIYNVEIIFYLKNDESYEISTLIGAD